MKLKKLPFDVRKEGDDSKLSVFTMLCLTGIEDEGPYLLEGDILSLKTSRFTWVSEASDPDKYRERFPLRISPHRNFMAVNTSGVLKATRRADGTVLQHIRRYPRHVSLKLGS